MKPILFNTAMVRAILEGRKTVTRRLVKPQPGYGGIQKQLFRGKIRWHGIGRDWKPPYRPGDILYVRETFCRQPSEEYPFVYMASVETPDAWAWTPSILMPREAARIFLRVTDVRVERLGDMTEADAISEGFEAIVCHHPCGCPCTDCIDTGYLEPAILGFAEMWDSTINPAGLPLYGWAANPWVWVIAFERIGREEVLPYA